LGEMTMTEKASVTAIATHDAPEAHHLPADPMVSMIERLVLNPEADLDKLERMLAMKERIDAKNAMVSFANALSAARAQIPPIIKDAKVDFATAKGRTQYKHETLAGIAKVIDPILSAHGISYRFRTDQGNGAVRVTCIIQHSAGHIEETSLAGAPDQSGNKNGFQAVGSAVTYLQRYTLKAALGLSAEVDDDAQSATPQRQPQAPRREVEHRTPANMPSPADQAIAALTGAETLDELAAHWRELPVSIQKLPEVQGAKDNRKAALQPPITDDEIPY
jgi:hypothetical protein